MTTMTDALLGSELPHGLYGQTLFYAGPTR